MECIRLIIGEVGTRERGGGLKVGRSERYRTTWTAMKTAMLRTKMKAAALLLLTPPPPEGSLPSLFTVHSDQNPTKNS